MTDFKERVAEFYEEARQLQDKHTQLASYYRIVAVKAKMLGDSLTNLEEAQRKYEKRLEIFGAGEYKITKEEARKEQPKKVSGGWYDYSEFET